jgi:hypothetical protein
MLATTGAAAFAVIAISAGAMAATGSQHVVGMDFSHTATAQSAPGALGRHSPHGVGHLARHAAHKGGAAAGSSGGLFTAKTSSQGGR